MERQWTVLEAGRPGRCRSAQDAAQELEISEHTLRYYEKLGLLGQIPRSSSGRRSYSSANLDLLRFILRLRVGPEGAVLPKTRATHMPLEDIKNYLELGTSPGPQSLVSRLEILRNHLHSIERQVNALEDAKKLLEGKVKRYSEVLEEQHEKA